MNVFGDYFFQDFFVVGYMCILRCKFYDSVGVVDLCVKYMYDEDNVIGFFVKSFIGRVWYIFGDKKLFDKEDIVNKNEVWNVVCVFVDEIYIVWKIKIVFEYLKYVVWNYVLILSEVFSIVVFFFMLDGQ